MSNLKRIREATGLSQAGLAEKSGVNKRMIQYYEQGVKDINKAEVLTVCKLALALECTVWELLESNLIVDDLSKPVDPELVSRLEKLFKQTKKEVEE